MGQAPDGGRMAKMECEMDGMVDQYEETAAASRARAISSYGGVVVKGG